MMSVLRVIGVLELLVITLGFWAFILLFHVLSDWRKSVMGQHFMYLMGVCASILTWGVTNSIVVIMPELRAVISLLMYGILAWIVIRQIRILIKTQLISRGTVSEVLEGIPTDEHTTT